MKRFFPNNNGEGFSYNDDDDNDHDNSNDWDDDLDMDDNMFPGEMMGVMQIGVVEEQFKQLTLDKALELAKQDWFWCFRSPATRLKRVEKIYQRLTTLLDDKDKEEKEKEV